MKPFSWISKISLTDALLLCGGLLSILWSIYFSLVTISIPYQIELREGAAQVMTGTFLRGGNPFVFDNQPLAMNNYGIVYNLIVLPFAWLFGNTLAVHRAVTFFFILASALLGFVGVYKTTRIHSLALACAAFIMTALIGRGSIGSFPTSLGVFLFLFSALFPFFRKFDQTSLFLSVFAALLAFYTKAYFVLGFGIVFSYLFLFVSKRKTFFYGLVFLSLFLVLALFIRLVFPLYFVNTWVGNVSNTSLSTPHLFAQLRDLTFIFYPVLIIFVVSLLLNFFDGKISLWSARDGVNVSNPQAPLFDKPVNYFFYIFFCCLLVFVLILGRHIGSYLNYAYQLLIPTFFLWFMQIVALGREKMKLLLFLIVLFNLFSWQKDLLNPSMLKQKDSVEWARVSEYLHASHVTLNSPATAAELIHLGQMPMDSGQTTYFYAVEPFSENLLTGINYDEFHDDGFRYTLLIDRMIEKQRFDLVITTKEKANFYHDKMLSDYYDQVDEIEVDMPQTGQHWTLVFWKPLQK